MTCPFLTGGVEIHEELLDAARHLAPDLHRHERRQGPGGGHSADDAAALHLRGLVADRRLGPGAPEAVPGGNPTCHQHHGQDQAMPRFMVSRTSSTGDGSHGSIATRAIRGHGPASGPPGHALETCQAPLWLHPPTRSWQAVLWGGGAGLPRGLRQGLIEVGGYRCAMGVPGWRARVCVALPPLLPCC